MRTDIEEIKRLYLSEELSSYEIAKITGIPSSTVRARLKKLGVMRNSSEATRVRQAKRGKEWMEANFTCRLCGETKPVSELVRDRRYFPFIYCCKKCAGY